MNEATARVTISRLMCGRSCGERGVTCYEFETGNQMHGVSLERLLDEEFPDGTVLEVSVRVVKRTRRWRLNPWLADERRFRRRARAAQTRKKRRKTALQRKTT